MKRHVALALLSGAVFLFAADGCIVNPLFPPELDVDGDGGRGGATSSSSSGGGTGGTSVCVCTTDDNNPCTDDLMMDQMCPGADEKSCHTVVVARPCTATGGKAGVCDADGMCIACSDCSDANCTNRCIGQACTMGTDCANGKCVDGFCCDSDCTGPCNSCKRVPGICSPLPVGITSDVAGDCMNGQTCDNTGTCKTPQNAVLGALCNIDAACESGKCVGQFCVSLNGQPCVEDLECSSRLCDSMTHKCVACSMMNPCPNGATCLAGGICAAQLGQPATNSAECEPPGGLVGPNMLMCTLPKASTCANDFECAFNDCDLAPNGTCADKCTIDASCPPGTNCNKSRGWCLLPPGSYCVIDDQCQGPMNTLGKCAGFPRRCQ